MINILTNELITQYYPKNNVYLTPILITVRNLVKDAGKSTEGEVNYILKNLNHDLF